MEKEKKKTHVSDVNTSIDYGSFNDKSTNSSVNIRFKYNNNQEIEFLRDWMMVVYDEENIKKNKFFVTHFGTTAENISKIDGFSVTNKKSFDNLMYCLVDALGMSVKVGEHTIENKYSSIEDLMVRVNLSKMRGLGEFGFRDKDVFQPEPHSFNGVEDKIGKEYPKEEKHNNYSQDNGREM